MRRILKPGSATLLYALMLLIVVMTASSLAISFSHEGSRLVVIVIAAAVSILLIGYLIYGYVRLATLFVRECRSRGRVVKLYFTDRDTRTIVNSSFSAFYDIAFSLYCYVLTLAERSLFLLSISVIYLLFGIAKLYIIRNYSRIPRIRAKVCRLLGIFFLVIGTAVAGIGQLIFLQEGGFTKRGLMIYVVAAYTLGVIVTTVMSTVKSYRDRNESWLALLRVKHVNVLYSVFTLTVSMMAAFAEDINSQQTMNLIVGTVTSALIIGYAVFMFVRAYVFSRTAG